MQLLSHALNVTCLSQHHCHSVLYLTTHTVTIHSMYVSLSTTVSSDHVSLSCTKSLIESHIHTTFPQFHLSSQSSFTTSLFRWSPQQTWTGQRDRGTPVLGINTCSQTETHTATTHGHTQTHICTAHTYVCTCIHPHPHILYIHSYGYIHIFRRTYTPTSLKVLS